VCGWCGVCVGVRVQSGCACEVWRMCGCACLCEWPVEHSSVGHSSHCTKLSIQCRECVFVRGVWVWVCRVYGRAVGWFSGTLISQSLSSLHEAFDSVWCVRVCACVVCVGWVCGRDVGSVRVSARGVGCVWVGVVYV